MTWIIFTIVEAVALAILVSAFALMRINDRRRIVWKADGEKGNIEIPSVNGMPITTEKK